MIRAYSEIIDFIANGTTPQSIVGFSVSDESKERVADLINREKTSGLSPDEISELDHYLKFEHIMRMVKAKAQILVNE